jgi:hypothetical protein
MGTKGGAVVNEQIALAEEEQLQRLEDTDPSTDDGRWGGDHCVHGTYVGTPGGADYICGLCEDGLDYWVEDPSYELTISVNDGPVFVAGSAHWPSNIAGRDRWALRRLVLLRRDIRTFSQLIEDSNRQAVPTFQMRLANSGRWEQADVRVVLNMNMPHPPLGPADVEDEIAHLFGVPVEAVFFHSCADEIDRDGRVILNGVEATIYRTGLTPSQLNTVAAFEVTK